jgi:hypothetical protein
MEDKCTHLHLGQSPLLNIGKWSCNRISSRSDLHNIVSVEDLTQQEVITTVAKSFQNIFYLYMENFKLT